MNAQLPPSFWELDATGFDADEIIVDSFAGGGGASTGIEMALGRSPDYAINHDAEALALHAANHPKTVHLSENIYKVDPMDVVGKRKVGLLWASPDCKHFSKAKGGAPVKRNIRDLAWTVVLWAERVSPRVIILENVEEFQGWGPLVPNAKGELMPCPDRRGETFKEWVAALKKLGYVVEWRELRACDFGAPTTRKRLFVIARRDGRKIVWPAPTHSAGGGKGLLPYRTAANDVIDWSIPCPSIFDTSDQIFERYGVRAVRPLAEATLARIAKGVKRYVIDAAEPFIVGCGGRMGQSPARGVDRPAQTLTAKADACLVMPHLVDVAHGEVSPSGVKRWGAGVKSAEVPMGNVTAGGIQQGVVAAVLSQAQQGGSVHDVDAPHPTVTASPKDQNQVVAAHLMTMRNAGKPFNEADKPTHTITAGGAGLSLVAASMVQTGYGEREGQEPRALDIEKPLGTVVAGAAKHAVVAAFLAQHNTDVVGHSAHEPVSTIVQKGSTQAVVSAGLLNLKGSDRRMSDVEEPSPAVTSQGNHLGEVRAFLMKYYGVDQDPRLEEPLSTVTTRDRFGIVTVEGEPYQIVDIGMRMLTPRELFKAQGFPADYEIETGVFADGTRRTLTKTAQVRMCGNSVCPPIAAALVSANCNDLAVMREAAE